MLMMTLSNFLILLCRNGGAYMYNTSVYLWRVGDAKMDKGDAKIAEKSKGRLITSNS